MLADPLPALPLRTHFADINTFMTPPVSKGTRPCPLPCVASLPSQEESTAVNDTLHHHRQEKENSTKSHWQLTTGLASATSGITSPGLCLSERELFSAVQTRV